MFAACPPPPPAVVSQAPTLEEMLSAVEAYTITAKTVDQSVRDRLRELTVASDRAALVHDYWVSLVESAQREGVEIPLPTVGVFADDVVGIMWTWPGGASLEVAFLAPDEIELTMFVGADEDEEEVSARTIDGAMSRTLTWLGSR